MWTAKCKTCNDFIKFEPRLRFLRANPTARDISGGHWRHDLGNRCRLGIPQDGRTPLQDVEFHNKERGAWSQAINGASNPDEK